MYVCVCFVFVCICVWWVKGVGGVGCVQVLVDVENGLLFSCFFSAGHQQILKGSTLTHNQTQNAVWTRRPEFR